MALTTHRELRDCTNWAFPGTVQAANAGWDGTEDLQTYITREWVVAVGKTLPSAVDITGQETAWRASVLSKDLAIAISSQRVAVDALRAAKLAAGLTFNTKTFIADDMSVGGVAAKYERLNRESASTARTITGVTLANPAVVASTAHGFSNGDRIDHTGVGGTVELAGIFTIGNVTANSYELTSVDGTAWAVFTSGGSATLTCEWTSVDNTINDLTAAGFLSLATALGNYSDLCFRTARTHKNAINALTDTASVNVYDYTTGWPSNAY